MKLVLLLLVIAVAVNCQTPWRWCNGSSGKNLNVTNVEVDPSPVMKGFLTNFEITGVARTDIWQNKAVLDVMNGGSKVYTGINTQPYFAPQGQPYDNWFLMTFPSFLPSGNFLININLVDMNNQLIECIEVKAQF